MNVLYVDIDGVLNIINSGEIIDENMVKVLSDICNKYDCKVVIESTHKYNKYKKTPEILTKLFELFNKYNIDLIGFTPNVEIHNNTLYIEHWKEYEILFHLRKHPYIDHFAIIDDNDYIDLKLLNEYLVEIDPCNGLTNEYVSEVGNKLKLINKYK